MKSQPSAILTSLDFCVRSTGVNLDMIILDRIYHLETDITGIMI